MKNFPEKFNAKNFTVTGANRGIGWNIVKQLLENPISAQWKIVLCARDAERGKEALAKLGTPSNVHLATVDVSNEESVNSLVQQLRNELSVQKINVLINNAGHVSMGALCHESALKTLDINYRGVKLVTETLLNNDMIDNHDKNSHIIMVSSQLSVIANGNEPKSQLFKEYRSLSNEQIDQLLDQYLQDVKQGGDSAEQFVSEKGWPTSSYRLSKMALNAYSRLLADKLQQVRVNMCCPGWCSTDLGGPQAPRTPEQGAAVAVWLATSPDVSNVTGKFFFENKEMEF